MENDGSGGDNRAGADRDAFENYGVGPYKYIVSNLDRAGTHEGFLFLERESALYRIQRMKIMVENTGISSEIDIFTDLDM